MADDFPSDKDSDAEWNRKEAIRENNMAEAKRLLGLEALRLELQNIIINLRFDFSHGGIGVSYPPDSGEANAFWRLDFVLGVHALEELKVTKANIKLLDTKRSALLDCIKKIDNFTSSYIPPKRPTLPDRPRYRVKAICRKMEAQPTT